MIGGAIVGLMPKLEGYFGTYDKVKKGTYMCTMCNSTKPHIEIIESDNQTLPKCPNCGESYWSLINEQ
jgi:NAD-dependent SIR2 family protein deacetylase